MNFYTLFTRTKDIHLIKDVGMLPESLALRHGDVRSFLVTYKNDEEYTHYGNEIKQTRLIFIKKRFGKYIDGIRFIKDNADQIDVLNIYHLNLSSFLYCLAAKCFLRKTAKVYLKLDAGYDEVRKLKKLGIVSHIKRRTIKLADIVTAETRTIVDLLQSVVNAKIEYLPNGVSLSEEREDRNISKDNRIITVGHLGTAAKNTEFLIDAFVASADKHPYELRLIGTYTQELKRKIEALKEESSDVYKRIVLTGEISDRERLEEEYHRAKIFAFPSVGESFGFALLEAVNAGCFVMVSDGVPLAYDVVDEGKTGMILPINDKERWGKAFTELQHNEPGWDQLREIGKAKVREKYSWGNIADRLYRMLGGVK